jgi:hypothetical protein
MPAQAGIQVVLRESWIPACAGMTPSIEITGDEALLAVVLRIHLRLCAIYFFSDSDFIPPRRQGAKFGGNFSESRSPILP